MLYLCQLTTLWVAENIWCLWLESVYGELVGWNWEEKTELLGQKTSQKPIIPPQFINGLPLDWIRIPLWQVGSSVSQCMPSLGEGTEFLSTATSNGPGRLLGPFELAITMAFSTPPVPSKYKKNWIIGAKVKYRHNFRNELCVLKEGQRNEVLELKCLLRLKDTWVWVLEFCRYSSPCSKTFSPL
jgi:hypothetical protein